MNRARIIQTMTIPYETSGEPKLSMGSLVLGITLVLTVPVVPVLGAHPVPLPASRGVTTDVLAMSSPRAPLQIPFTSPSVAYTLDLCTNYLYSGNALPTDCSLAGPHGVVYDSGKGEVFVANFNSFNVSVISDATNTVVASIPVGSGLAS